MLYDYRNRPIKKTATAIESIQNSLHASWAKSLEEQLLRPNIFRDTGVVNSSGRLVHSGPPHLVTMKMHP